MKKITNKSILIATLLGTLIVTGCQGVSSSSTSCDCSASTISNESISYASVRPTEYGVTVIKQLGEATPKEGLTFKVDSLNEEFCLKSYDLYVKGAERGIIYDVSTLFLADANKDGYLDFIFSSLSSTMSDPCSWIAIYDYHNSQTIYHLEEPSKFDYRLVYNEPNIIVEQYTSDNYDSKNVFQLGRLVGKGILDYSEAEITTRWQNFLNVDAFDFNVTLADKNRTPVTLEPDLEKDTYVVAHASVDQAYCITTNIVRNSGNYDDLTGNLPVGYRLNGDYRLIQATANNHQDNVVITLDAMNLKMKDQQGTIIEVCVSGYIYKIAFSCDTLDYDRNGKTLKEAFGWNIAKEDIVEFSTEYIPGGYNNPYTEEEYPFMYVSVAANEEATQTSYNILQGLVAEIDPSLVEKLAEPKHYHFKTNENKYSFNGHHAFIECNNTFYVMIYAKNYAYATSNSTGYVRFRDSHTEITALGIDPGSENKVIQNATSIIFKQKSSSVKDPENVKYRALFTFTIANNQFYIMDSKTMILKKTEYEVVSENDFLSIIQTA
ncbi:MAG: hypothetical protein IK028_03580 [Bacilli bacterium]|nr:hypothetical protein [Bacilli bacterium]